MKNTQDWKEATGKALIAIKTKVFNDPKIDTNSKKNDSPFESVEWGDHFRSWVNDNLPSIAKKYNLSRKGPHNNENIINTSNHVLTFKSGKTMKVIDYYKQKNPELILKKSIESGFFPIPQTIRNADRINKELFYINQREEYKNKPFFIVDPLWNLVLAFNEKHRLIDYSQSVAGADKQLDKVLTFKDWCDASELKYDPYKMACVDKEVTSKKDSENTQRITPRYDVLEKLSLRSQKEGIYQVKTTSYTSGYQGKKDVYNTFGLQTQDGVRVPTAIHGLVKGEDRIVADQELSKFLQKEKSFGNIPKQYIDMDEKLTSKYDLSYGCFNVSAEFINNKEVLRIARQKAFVFIMSERKENYLVRVTPDKQDDFFANLKGDGENCKSIESVGVESGGEGINTAMA